MSRYRLPRVSNRRTFASGTGTPLSVWEETLGLLLLLLPKVFDPCSTKMWEGQPLQRSLPPLLSWLRFDVDPTSVPNFTPTLSHLGMEMPNRC